MPSSKPMPAKEYSRVQSALPTSVSGYEMNRISAAGGTRSLNRKQTLHRHSLPTGLAIFSEIEKAME